MKTRARSGEHGFTLVEVLVGLAVSSLILVSLNLAMTVIRQSSERTRDSLAGEAALSTAAQIFSEDVSRIARIRRSASETSAVYVFTGRPREMIYPLFEYRGLSAGALYAVRLRVEDQGSIQQLIRDRAALPPGNDVGTDLDWGDAVVLIDGPFDIALAYRAPNAGGRAWEDDWVAAAAMPEQVRLSVKDRQTGRLRFPVLVQPLLANAEAECAALGPGCKDVPREASK
jgi:prepilin-type N-terminal cleavage/methylation domain-containing protein